MSKHSVQDTIQFDVKAEQVVTNDTVRVTAQLVGMILSETAEQSVRESIRTLMKKFISTDWQFSNTQRSAHASGREQITLTATARVPESENYALDRRRDEAGRDSDSMKIVSAVIDTSPTASQIEETQRKLRLEILKKAQDELKLINEAMNDKYRLGQVVFQASGSDAANQAYAASARGGMLSGKTAYGSGFAEDDDTIGNAVKMTMQASVQLRISRN